MKCALYYPPTAYPYMPYLAPHLLKGFVEENSEHKIEPYDINIHYHHYIWKGEFAENASKELLSLNAPKWLMLSSEMLQQHGEAAYETLRERKAYRDKDTIAEADHVLRLGFNIEKYLNEGRGINLRATPFEYDSWRQHTELLKNSVMGKYLESYVAGIEESDYEAFGICAAYQEQMAPTVLLASLLKALFPNKPIIVGGGAITHYLHYLIKDHSYWECIDYAIPFEGEIPFIHLLEYLSGAGGEAPPEENVAYKINETIHYIENLQSKPKVQPVADYSAVPDMYPTPETIYPILTSKGCYWGKCSFCTHHEGYGQGYYKLKNDTYSGTIRKLVENGGKAFYFVDEALPPQKLKEFATLFQGLNVGLSEADKIGWTSEARIEKVITSDKAVKLLKDSNCRLLVSGIESGSDEVSKVMKKGIDLNCAEEFARLCKAHDIKLGWMFFIGHPGETLEQARESFELIARAAENISYATVGTFALERGSPIWNYPEAFGVKEVHGQEDPYRVNFNYSLKGDEIHSRKEIKARLRSLHKEYPELDDIFTRAVDRALGFFMDSLEPIKNRPPKELVFTSHHLSNSVCYYPAMRKFAVRK